MVIQGIAYKLYDCSLPFPDRVNRCETFESAIRLGRYLGISPNKIPEYCNPLKKKRFYSKIHKKEFAIRKCVL